MESVELFDEHLLVSAEADELCKTAEPIEMPSGASTRVGPRNHVWIPPEKGATLLVASPRLV